MRLFFNDCHLSFVIDGWENLGALCVVCIPLGEVFVCIPFHFNEFVLEIAPIARAEFGSVR